MTTFERFMSKVVWNGGEDECWTWEGARTDRGYGNFSVKGKRHVVHRFAYESFVGEIPTGLVLDHLCRNPRCVNPVHLEPVTNRENVLRGVGPTAVNALKTHCKRSHPLSGDNLFINVKGERICVTCERAATRRRRQRLREARA